MRSIRTIGAAAVAAVLIGAAVNLLADRGRAQQRTPPPPGASAPADVRATGVKFGEASLRSSATKAPMPVYPAASLAKKVGGVAVVSILVGFEGAVEQVEILEAPDAAIGNAVREAVMRWTFRPATVGTAPEPWKVRGKLTFYFVASGKGQVASPGDAPGAGQGTAPVPEATVISEADMLARARDGRSVILDIRPRDAFKRGARPGAVNIPSDEIVTRAVRELGTRPVVIDCAAVPERSCRQVAQHLRSLRFHDVAMVIGR